MSTPIQRGAEALAILWRDENAAGGFGPTDIQTTRAVFASIDVDDMGYVLVAHQRASSDRCACGWSELGMSHAHHQSDAIIAWLMGGGE